MKNLVTYVRKSARLHECEPSPEGERPFPTLFEVLNRFVQSEFNNSAYFVSKYSCTYDVLRATIVALTHKEVYRITGVSECPYTVFCPYIRYVVMYVVTNGYSDII